MTGVLVIIASPGDTSEERTTVRDYINDWNINNGRRAGVVLLPWLYERSSVPKLGERVQAIINSQAVDRADVVVAFFDGRLGTSTGVDVSGTAEEIRRAHELNKPVHVYFSNEPLPRDVDLDQQSALREFRAELEREGLLGDYNDPADLGGQIIRALEHDIDLSGWSNPVLSSDVDNSGAKLKWWHEHESRQKGLDKNGKMQYQTVKNSLIVENSGDIAAEALAFEVTGIEDTEIVLRGATSGITIEPSSSRQWIAIPVRRGTVQIDATWEESGESKKQSWTVRVG